MYNDRIVIRGGGDLATGVIQKFWRSGFKVVVLEIEKPTAIRRTVSIGMAAIEGKVTVEDMTCEKVESTENLIEGLEKKWDKGIIPLLIDPGCKLLPEIKPDCVIDAIIAKKNMGTHRSMSKVTIALGPGFHAPADVDAVIETMRSHSLGRLITDGQATANTGIPGELGGKSNERVIHSTVDGRIKHIKSIGEEVKKDELIFYVNETGFYAPFDGILRGLISEEIHIFKGMKIADIDPRIGAKVDCYTISDKARCIGGAALEAYFYMKRIL